MYMYVYKYLLLFIIFIPIYQPPLLGQDMTQGQLFF